MDELLTPTVIVPLALGVLGTGGLGVLVGAVLTHRRESKRDRANAIVAYAAQIQQRLEFTEQQQHQLWEARRADALVIRSQGDHIDVLEHHIWQGLGPPPPPRPAGV